MLLPRLFLVLTFALAVSVTGMAAAQRTESQKAAIAEVEKVHADWRVVAASDGFKAWLATQPQEVQRLVADTWNPKDVIRALDLFKTSAGAAKTPKLVKEMDEKSRLEVQRPARWFPQDRPNAATVFMYGLEGAGYSGNCNINLLESPSTAHLTQAEVDESENRKPLSKAFFEPHFRNLFEGAVVSRVLQTQIGDKWGHLVEYSYSYIDASSKRRFYMQNVVFSHSRPSKVWSFTCTVGVTLRRDAALALQAELPAFNALVATSRFVNPFDRFDTKALFRSVDAQKQKKELGPIDRWRYDSCRESATKAPTTVGVNRGLSICDEKFDQ